jgi:hypothetical protein
MSTEADPCSEDGDLGRRLLCELELEDAKQKKKKKRKKQFLRTGSVCNNHSLYQTLKRA